MNNHTNFNLCFLLFNLYTQVTNGIKKLKINQTIEWEKDTITLDCNVENLWRDKKSWVTKNVHYEEQKPNTRFYLIQAYWSFIDHLTSTFPFLASQHLFLKNTWNLHQTWFWPLLEATQEENEFSLKFSQLRKW